MLPTFSQFYLAGLPAFLLYFASGIAYLGLFGAIYSQVTRHKEFTLIREGNLAAVVAFLGALAGFALPLAKSIAQSVNLIDFAVWATIALVVQVFAYWTACLAMRGVTARMNEGHVATGLWLGGVAVLFGILNSASMTYVPAP